jgi:DNA replication and repair protein RecF
MPPTAAAGAAAGAPVEIARPQLWVERLHLTNFRNYSRAVLPVGPEPVVLTGPNGSGKTNLLEAVSLLTAGQGLRRAPYAELARLGCADWAVAATVRTPLGTVRIGTGLKDSRDQGARSGRVVRIDGEERPGSGVLAGLVDAFWLTPAMDGLFMGPAAERRRFLDRLIGCFDPGYRTRLAQFERAMQQRNRLLADDAREPARFTGLERIMAETGIAIAAARAGAVAELRAAIVARCEAARANVFPWAELAIAGLIETDLAMRPAIEVEDTYLAALADGRDRDRAAGRTLAGPHRSDLVVGHGPKSLPASVCSTGEQKALLIGLILAQADLVRRRRDGATPILLLDEIAAHLDPPRRAALFDEIVALGSQTWMTGTDIQAFSQMAGRAQFHCIDDGRITPLA